jgi:hypothetical protein
MSLLRVLPNSRVLGWSSYDMHLPILVKIPCSLSFSYNWNPFGSIRGRTFMRQYSELVAKRVSSHSFCCEKRISFSCFEFPRLFLNEWTGMFHRKVLFQGPMLLWIGRNWFLLFFYCSFFFSYSIANF